MALSEDRILSQVTVLPQQSAVNVQWLDRVLRTAEDGSVEVIAATPFRKAYTADQKEEFLTEVEGAAGYVATLGW